MFDAVYIADKNNNLVFEFLIRLESPSFKSLTNTISSIQDTNNNDVDATPLIDVGNNYYICYQNTENLIIYVLCSKTEGITNPAIPFIFINRLIEVMEDYFGVPLALTKIEANNDTLTLLLNEMLDDGIPNTTDFNKLRDLIPFKSLLSKILSTSNELKNAASKKSLSSLTHNTRRAEEINTGLNSIPWRRSNVKYTNNEMYVDVIETVSVILQPVSRPMSKNAYSSKFYDSAFYSSSNSTSSTELIPITGYIDGKIDFISHLTGVPLLQMILKVGGLNINSPSFHRCIKSDSWAQSPGLLSFIPPDGKSTLINYQIDLDLYSRNEQLDMLGLIQVDFQSGLGPLKNEFQIKLFVKSHKSVSKIENLKIQIFCKSESSEGTKDSVVNIKSTRTTHGDFTYNGEGEAEWNLRSVSTGIQPFIQGSIFTESLNTLPEDLNSTSNLIEDVVDESLSIEKASKPIYLKLSYGHKGSVPSGLKVDSLKIVSAKGLGDTVKPYKGVKYITNTGNFIIRS